MPNPAIHLRGSALTNQGRVRQNNEDSVDLWIGERFMMAVVADGMGGAVAGEEASRIAIETIRKMMSQDMPSPDDYHDMQESDLGTKLRDSVLKANRNIVEQANHNPELRGMGTTLTLAFARQNEITLAHVGDSRAYLVDGQNGDIEQLTADHSFVQALVDAGHISAAEAENHPMSNVLYRALGQGDDIDIDIYEGVRLHIGDRLVLCSDGLTLHLKPHEIADIALADKDPDMIGQNLINLALERGGRDNVSVVVLVVDFDNTELIAEMGLDNLDVDDDAYETSQDAPSDKQSTEENPSVGSAESNDDNPEGRDNRLSE
jgi:serine/threonine protein phosphatase PrpC